MTVLLTSYSAGKRNDEENAKEKLYTYASHVPISRESFKVRFVSRIPEASCCSCHCAGSWDSDSGYGVDGLVAWLFLRVCSCRPFV